MPTFRKKGFSASQSKATSRRMNNAMYGTHHVRQGTQSRHVNASDVRFSNARKTRRAEHGVVSYVQPTSSSRESYQNYTRRVNTADFSQKIQHASTRRRVLVVALAVVLALIAAFAAAFAVFNATISGRVALDASDPKANLTTAASTGGYNVLVAADLSGVGKASQCMAVVVHVDPDAGALTYVALPSTTRVKLSDGQNHSLYEALSTGGQATLVSSVSEVLGVPINHLVYMDAQGISDLVTYLGGLTVDVSEDVDDPAAGSDFIAKGTQTLNASQMLTYLRATNFTDGVRTQAANQGAFACALATRLAQATGIGSLTQLDRVSNYIHTDWSAMDLLNLQKSFAGINLVCQGSAVDGDVSSSDGTFVCDTDDVAQRMTAALSNQVPAVQQNAASLVNHGAFTITVKNGSGITGGAAQLASILTNAGYNVTAVGNADSAVYTETLIIYLDDNYKLAAEAVADTLGTGRVVDGSSYYAFDTSVQVVLGSDWKPLN